MSSDSKTATAAPDRRPLFPARSRNRALSAALGLLLAALAGCASPAPAAHPREPRQPPAAQETPVAQETPAPATTPTPTPAPSPEPEAAPRGDEVVVIDPGGEAESSPHVLVDAARAERERRAHAAPSAIVINDKNLKQHATGQLTVATPGKKTGAAEAGTDPQPVRDEQYWRSRALEIRLRWRHAADDVKELEASAGGWRRRFYAENDLNVRNAQIKPEWDRVLDRLEEARAEVEASRKELAELLEEGRTAGALPGWLREGVDQEPQDEPEPSNTHKVIEPPKADAGKDGHGA
jgi:hypothetical protein